LEQSNFELLHNANYLPEMEFTPDSEDYTENGLLMCGKCRTPKQKIMQFHGSPKTVWGVLCKCAQEKEELRRKEQRLMEFETRMQNLNQGNRISDMEFLHDCFETAERYDDEETQALTVCERYIENWKLMRKNNIGMLIYGSVGAGKTFLANCMASAMFEQMVTATVTSFPRLLNLLQDSQNRQELLDQLNRYDLLVIDDLGAERDSAYALEQVFSIIDARAKIRKPLIVTTNLSLQELKHPQNMACARIYDRILELCPITLKMTGESRRAELAKEKRELARRILLGTLES